MDTYFTMKTLFSSILLSTILCHVLSATVTIKQGTLRGTQLESRDGRNYSAFEGIPFAKPPVGDLRFKSPVPHPGWQGEFNATQPGPMCLQNMVLIPALRGQVFGQEDCLYLNVYIPETNPAKKLPVMVWIYGGAFFMGDSGNQGYGPRYFMDRDVILVTFNYRLGALGFLSFEDNYLPGNFGLKDQQLALQWVHRNIHAFGGDPKSITIFGESSGAASVNYQLISPKSQGLFHKAIIQSGSAFCPWGLVPRGKARKRAHTFATLLSCYGEEEEVVECLKNVPAETILDTQFKFAEWRTNPLVTFAPVIESTHPNSFITRHPNRYRTSPSIPLIIGINQDEGVMRTADLCSNNFEGIKELNNRWQRYLPLTLMLQDIAKTNDIPSVVTNVTDFYLSGKKVDENNIRNFTDMVSDIIINQAVIKTAERHDGKIYFYLYNYKSQVSYTSIFGSCPVDLGVSHADELINLFNLDNVFPNNTLQGKSLEMSKTMLSLWTNFATNGIPTDDAKQIEWSQFESKGNRKYLEFGQTEISTKENPLESRYKFINSLPINSRYFIRCCI